MTTMARNEALTLVEGRWKIAPPPQQRQVGGQGKHLLTLGAVILAYATGSKCLRGPPFG